MASIPNSLTVVKRSSERPHFKVARFQNINQRCIFMFLESTSLLIEKKFEYVVAACVQDKRQIFELNSGVAIISNFFIKLPNYTVPIFFIRTRWAHRKRMKLVLHNCS